MAKTLVFSNSPWWKNLRNGASVSMLIQGQCVQGNAKASDDHLTVMQQTGAYLAQHGIRSARFIGLELDAKRELTAEELDMATQGRAVIFIEHSKG